MIRILTDRKEIESLILPHMQSNGFGLSQNAVIFAEFDDSGKLMAFLPLQQWDMVDGVVSLSPKSNIRTLWGKMLEFLGEVGGKTLLAIPSSDKVARACEALGCVATGQKVYRRDF